MPNDITFMTYWYNTQKNAFLEWFYGTQETIACDLAAAAALEEGTSVLDIGCNVGNITLFLARHFNCHAAGIDASQAAIKVAQDRAQQQPAAISIVFHLADACTMPLGNCEFDAIISKDSFVNIEDKPRLFDELHRVLKQGGRLAFTDWVWGNTNPTAAYCAWREMVETETLHLVSIAEYTTLLCNAGFQKISVRDRTEEFRAHITERYETFSAAEPAEIQRRFGIADYDRFIEQFALKQEAFLAGDVLWVQISAQKQ